MTVRLRAHHLLCMLTYVGKGYSPAFTAQYDRVAGRLAQGEDILVVEGPDDICAPLLREEAEPHCHKLNAAQRDDVAAAAVGDLLGQPVRAGVTLVLDGKHLAALRDAFASGGIRAACAGCSWASLCDSVSAGAFAGTTLLAGAGDVVQDA